MSKVYYEYTHLCGNEEETFPSVVGQNRKRPVGDSSSTISSPSKGQRSQRRYKISMKTHRDVTAFQKKHQIGGGNYGYDVLYLFKKNHIICFICCSYIIQEG